MGALKLRDRVADLIEEVESAGYEKCELNLGNLFLKEKNETGFHVYFIYNVCPNSIGTRFVKNPKILEMKYDLRNREYWVKSNLKEVKFSERNIEPLFAGGLGKTIEMISTEGNEKMYKDALSDLGSLGNEYVSKPHRFLYRLIVEHPYYELLHKIGLSYPQYRTSIVNKNGKSPIEIFDLSKSAWKIYSKYKISSAIINRRRGYHFVSNDVLAEREKMMLNYLAKIEKLSEKYGFSKIREFYNAELDYLYSSDYGEVNSRRDPWSARDSTIYFSQKYNTNINRLIEYIYFEVDVSQGMSAREAISILSDYYRMSIAIGNRNFDKYPRFLKTYHDVVMQNYKMMKNDIKQEEFKKAMEGSEELEYKYGGLRIIAPKDSKEIVFEGNEQGHCVGSYVDRVISGGCKILFLRANPDEPLVTVELAGERIVQAKGKFNRDINNGERHFLRKYAKNKGFEFSSSI